MTTISEKIKLIYHKSSLVRQDKLVEMKAPEVVIKRQEEITQGWLDGSIKLPGEVRGHYKKYLEQEFTEGFKKIINNKLQMWFKIEDNTMGYLHLYRDKWDNICFSTSMKPTISKLTQI